MFLFLCVFIFCFAFVCVKVEFLAEFLGVFVKDSWLSVTSVIFFRPSRLYFFCLILIIRCCEKYMYSQKYCTALWSMPYETIFETLSLCLDDVVWGQKIAKTCFYVIIIFSFYFFFPFNFRSLIHISSGIDFHSMKLSKNRLTLFTKLTTNFYNFNLKLRDNFFICTFTKNWIFWQRGKFQNCITKIQLLVCFLYCSDPQGYIFVV